MEYLIPALMFPALLVRAALTVMLPDAERRILPTLPVTARALSMASEPAVRSRTTLPLLP